MPRIGHGFDAHCLTDGKQLILGGVSIEFPKGLLGHSDADVLTHAVCDSLLGAAALGDIGKFFPDTDDKYKNISSLTLLEKVCNKVINTGYEIGNVDVTVAAEAPRLSPHILLMRQNLAKAMKIDIDQVSIKATTTEGLGFTGRGEGIAAWAVALLTDK